MRGMTTMYQHELDERDWERKARRPQSAPFPKLYENRWWDFTNYLMERGLDPVLAKDNKWYPTLDVDEVPRIVIPATNTTGHGFWQARATVEHPKRYQSPSVSRGDSVVLVWPYSAPEKVVVVEGPMDALAAAECGVLGVSLMGNTPTPAVLNHVSILLPSLPVLVIGDSDAINEAARLVGALATRGRKVTIRLLPCGVKDIAELNVDERRKVIL
jgi:hypothetical protein